MLTSIAATCTLLLLSIGDAKKKARNDQEDKEGMGRMRSVSGKEVYEELGDGGGGRGGGVVEGRKDRPCEPMEGWGGS